MTPVTKQAWIDALRSGEFNQCTGALGKLDPESGDISYCCLGVLAAVAGAGHRFTPLEGDGILVFDFGDGSEDSGIIPLSVRDTIVSDLDLNLPGEVRRDRCGWQRPDDLMRTLSSMNDNGVTFDEIADYIDEVADANQ